MGMNCFELNETIGCIKLIGTLGDQGPCFLLCMLSVHDSSDKDDTTCSQNLQELDTVK